MACAPPLDTLDIIPLDTLDIINNSTKCPHPFALKSSRFAPFRPLFEQKHRPHSGLAIQALRGLCTPTRYARYHTTRYVRYIYLLKKQFVVNLRNKKRRQNRLLISTAYARVHQLKLPANDWLGIRLLVCYNKIKIKTRDSSAG